MNDIRQAAPLNGYHSRSTPPFRPPVVNSRTSRIPRPEEVPGAPDAVRDGLQKWFDLHDRVTNHAREEAKANAAAAAAAADYRRKVRDAIAEGNDPSRIKDETEKHRATAAAHRDFHRTASSELERHGHALGPILAEHAATIAETVDTQVDEAAARVRAAQAALADTWHEWSYAFGLRMWLSSLAMGVESVPAFHGADRHLPAVAEATAHIEKLLDEPDRLRSDEEAVRAWRSEQDQVRATAARTFGVGK